MKFHGMGMQEIYSLANLDETYHEIPTFCQDISKISHKDDHLSKVAERVNEKIKVYANQCKSQFMDDQDLNDEQYEEWAGEQHNSTVYDRSNMYKEDC